MGLYASDISFVFAWPGDVDANYRLAALVPRWTARRFEPGERYQSI
jgi:hypothetical protein